MSKKSGIATLATTVTVTIFAMAMVFVTDPRRGNDNYSDQVLAEAKNRQNSSIATISEPLKTKDVLREEDIMAEKVAVILGEDEDFTADIGDKALDYVENNFASLESMFSSSLQNIVKEGDEASRSYADSSVATAKDELEGEISNLESEIERLKALESELQGQLDAQKKEIDKLNSQDNTALIASSLLNDDAFIDEIIKAISGKVSESVLNSEEFSNALKDVVNSYLSQATSSSSSSTSQVSIPTPVFKSAPSVEYSEEEYVEKRNERREIEINRILDFLGY